MPDSAQKHQHGKARGIGMSVPAPLGASGDGGLAEEGSAFPATATLLSANYKSLTNTYPEGRKAHQGQSHC